MLLRTIFVLAFLFCIILQADCRHDRYMVRKGGRLERLHKRTLSEWKKAHHRPRSNRHKRRRHERDGRMHIEHVLAHMDSFVRPRFGRYSARPVSIETQMASPVSVVVFALCILAVLAQYDDIETEKRAMRNALVRFGRAGGGARNALVRFGKRSSDPFLDQYESSMQDKRNGAPQPFVRFGRSGRLEHMHDILSTLQKLDLANSK